MDGVGVIDPQPMLCPGRRCYAVDGRHLVYRNYGHLARPGSGPGTGGSAGT